MPSNNPLGGLYTGGAVVVNTQPSVNFYAQLLAHRQAKADAMDEYIRNMGKNINKAGMRTQDMEEFDRQYEDIQKYRMENQKDLSRGNRPKLFELEQKWKGLGELVNNSKLATAQRDTAIKYITDLRNKNYPIPSSFITDLHSHDLPLIDQSRKSIDLGNYLFEQKPFDEAKSFLKYKTLKRTPQTPVIGATDPLTLKRNITQDEIYDQNTKDVIWQQAALDYEEDPSFNNQIKNAIAEPKIKQNLEKIAKEEFGTDNPDEHDYAAAYILQYLQPKITKTIKTEDDKLAMAAQRQKYAQANIRLAAALRNYNSKDYYNYREGKNKEKTEGILNGLIDKQYNSGKRALMDVDGKSYSGNVVPASTIGKTVNLPTYQYLDKTKNAYELPTEFLITDDKQTIIPIFRDKKGNSEGIKSKPIPISTYKLDLGNTYLTRKDSKDELISDLEKETPQPAKPKVQSANKWDKYRVNQ